MKQSFADRQTVLVNSACALKFPETYSNRWAKLWKVLAKYHHIPDHFHYLKTSLHTNFELLKTATKRNVQNLPDLIEQQQTYINALGEHINTLYAKLAQSEQ